jgi:hypothetical protein
MPSASNEASEALAKTAIDAGNSSRERMLLGSGTCRI